jgi:hypothetical protein
MLIMIHKAVKHKKVQLRPMNFKWQVLQLKQKEYKIVKKGQSRLEQQVLGFEKCRTIALWNHKHQNANLAINLMFASHHL